MMGSSTNPAYHGLSRACLLLREGAVSEAKQVLFDLYEAEHLTDHVNSDQAALHIERALGECFALEQCYEESFEWYRRAYWKDRTHADTLYSLAIVERERRSDVTAVQYCSELLQLHPNHADGLALRAQLHLRMGSWSLAEADIASLRPFNKPLASALDEKIRRRNAEQVVPAASSRAEPVIEEGERASEAMNLMLQSRYRDVIRLLKGGKRSPEELLMLASAWTRQANYDCAKRCLLELLCESVHVNKRETFLGIAMLAHVYERTCEYDKALQELKKVRGEDSMGVHLARIVEGQCAESRGDWLSAATQYRLVCEAVPHPLAFLRLGYVRLQQMDYSEAKSLLEKIDELPHAHPCFSDSIGFVNRKTIRGAACVYRGLVNHKLGIRASDLLWKATELHENFGCVQPSMASIDTEAVIQKLRGICDLDLTGEEAYIVVDLLRGSAQATFSGVAPGVSPVGLDFPRKLGSPLGIDCSLPSDTPWSPRKSPFHASTSTTQAGPSSLLSSMPLSSTTSSTHPFNPPMAHAPEQNLWLFPKMNVGLSATSLPMCQLNTGSGIKPVGATIQPSLKLLCAPGAPVPRGGLLTTQAVPMPPSPSASSYLISQEIFRRAEVVLGDFLGEGSFGSVYKACVRGNVCACKMIHKQSITAEAEFMKEIDSFKHLKHPRLVRFYGIVQDGTSIAGMLTEYMENGNLYAKLFGSDPNPVMRATKLPDAIRVSLALEVVEGLLFLHSHQPPVVHRDMKSMNVLLDADFHAKLCDFGLTQPLEAGKTHLTRCGEEKGSPRYMAPEYYDERLTLTEKVDIWAYGCTLVEIFGGTVPYCECSTLQQLCAKIMVAKVAPSTPACDLRIEQIMQGCFEFDPRERISAATIFRHLQMMQ